MVVHLTQQDTRLIYEDALPWTRSWATCRTLELAGDPLDTDDADPVTAWQVEVREDESGTTWTVDHDAIIAAMTRIVEHQDQVRLNDEITGQVRAVIAATDNTSATDEVCQLDVQGFDAIVQVATIGKVIYG